MGDSMEKDWQILKPNADLAQKIQRALKCGPHISAILANRNMASASQLSAFLNPSLSDIRSPSSLKGMDKAVKRISMALEKNEKILIFGDYDVDGITATAILFDFLGKVGGDASYYIPHRIKEGYGLGKTHIHDYAAPKKIDLIVTVDCGVTAHEAVAAAKEKGIDVIITDHHRVESRPPDAVAVVNPHQKDCPSNLTCLSGVGVAFYLLIALRKHLREIDFWDEKPEPNLLNRCDLVALGTSADQVPMVNESRIFTRAGMGVISQGKRRGLKALMKQAKVQTKHIDSDDILFRIAPRLNAAGRMSHARFAVELLTTANARRAKEISSQLSDLNAERKTVEDIIFKEAVSQVENDPSLIDHRPLVLSSPTWHEGITGIVASRLVEKFSRPTILISTRNGMGKGSGRSIGGFDLYDSISACSKDLQGFGGHSMAAGLTIKKEDIPSFSSHLKKVSRDFFRSDRPAPPLLIDCEINLNQIAPELIDKLESLRPFGTQNPEPLFMARQVFVISSDLVGGVHRRMTLGQNQSQTQTGRGTHIAAIQFNIDPQKPPPELFQQIAFKIRWNRWRNKKTAQILIEATG